jgi:hypothetical protein
MLSLSNHPNKAGHAQSNRIFSVGILHLLIADSASVREKIELLFRQRLHT